MFQTQKEYSDRPTKAAYMHDKYGAILKDSVLDVGSDECHLKGLLGDGVKYTGIGMGGNPDVEVNLETETIPFEDNSYEVVMCLDVLEHLDNTHGTFNELCRVSKRYVIIALPNSYRDFLGMLFGRKKDKHKNFKYYGLPDAPQMDRHKWFFSSSDAHDYIRGCAVKNNMNVVQIDNDGDGTPKTLKSALKRSILWFVSLFTCVKATDLYYKTTWAVLEKSQPEA